MIEKILNKLGYYKTQKQLIESLNEDMLCLELAKRIGDVYEYTIDQADEIRLFKDLSAVEGFNDYLRATCAKDIQRYFGCESEVQRQNVKGAFARTIYLRSKIAKKNDLSRVEPLGDRYAK